MLVIRTIYNIFANSNQKVYHLQLAQMAESVDALVSNTSGAIRAGSIPALGTSKRLSIALSLFCLYTISYLLRLWFVHQKRRFVENNLPITVFVHNSGLSVEKHHYDPATVHHIRIFVEEVMLFLSVGLHNFIAINRDLPD